MTDKKISIITSLKETSPTNYTNIQKSSIHENISYSKSLVSRHTREQRNGHYGGVLWFTGYPGAGKSTLAYRLEETLSRSNYNICVLDGDNIRHGLNADLDFSPAHRSENTRRMYEVAKLFADAGIIVILSLISPFRADRDDARNRLGKDFHEIYINSSLEACIKRDPKGLYKRALNHEIKDFTGIDSPYEVPDTPELTINIDNADIEYCVERLRAYAEKVFSLGSG